MYVLSLEQGEGTTFRFFGQLGMKTTFGYVCLGTVGAEDNL